MRPIEDTPPDTPTLLSATQEISAFFIYFAVGLVQGLLLAALNKNSAAAHPVLFFSLFMVAVLIPLAFYCSQAAHLRRRLWILGLTTAIILAVGIHQGATVREISRSGSQVYGDCFLLSFILALAVFVGIPAVAVSATTWEARYQRWVAAALQTFGALAQAGLILGLCWMVIASSASLFVLVGAEWLNELVFKREVAIIASSLIFALAVARDRRDDSMMHTIFTRFMQLCGWIYPIIAAVGILFVASWVTGIGALLKTHRAVTILLWFIALLIFFFNLHCRCGTEERNEKWLRVLTALCWLAAIPMLLVALYGLGVRIEAHGFTPIRVWGLFTTGVIAIFVLGYAAHSARELLRPCPRGKTLLSGTHLVATIALVVGILLMLSGIADPRRISVSSQLRQLQLQRGEAIEDDHFTASVIDFSENVIDFLQEKGGIYGENALRELATRSGNPTDNLVAQYARSALDGKRAHRIRNDLQQQSVSDVLRSLQVFPGAEAPPPGLVEFFAEYPHVLPDDCRVPQGAEPICIIWKVRFEKNEVESYVPLTKHSYAKPFRYSDSSDYSHSGTVWQETGKGYWERAGRLASGCVTAPEALFAAVLANSVQFAPPQNPRSDILANGIRITPPSPAIDCPLSTP
ncbi:MAG: DUF4153 domain-containing protein [Zoogloeaceae bacterium]|jgi:hypothetical protein|nr:DUF4153 domain-containing protein [Zoogloeaceae bacterium]